jgi:molybdopterin-guanine dinucleotide biosynthesis protein MobB
MTCIVQLVGPSGSGKTRVIVSVSRRLKNLGFKVAVVKHTPPCRCASKDSWRFIEEGGADYAVVLRGSGERVAVFTRDQSIDRVVGELSKTVDVILVEGFKDLRLGYKVELGGGENLEEVSEKVLEELLECLRKAGRA